LILARPFCRLSLFFKFFLHWSPPNPFCLFGASMVFLVLHHPRSRSFSKLSFRVLLPPFRFFFWLPRSPRFTISWPKSLPGFLVALAADCSFVFAYCSSFRLAPKDVSKAFFLTHNTSPLLCALTVRYLPLFSHFYVYLSFPSSLFHVNSSSFLFPGLV